jgi:hypothetical protein
MKTAMEALAAVELVRTNCVNMRSGIEKTLGPKKESLASSLIKRKPQCLHQRINRMIALSTVIGKVTIATFTAKSIMRGNGLEQRGFSAAVFSGKETNARTQDDLFDATDCRNAEWIRLPIRDTISK